MSARKQHQNCSHPGLAQEVHAQLLSRAVIVLAAIVSAALLDGSALRASEAGSAELNALSALEHAYPVNAGAASSMAGQPDGSFAPIHHFHTPTPEELAAQILPLPNILRDPGLSLDVRYPERFCQPGRVSFSGVGVDVRPLGAREQSVGQLVAENTLIYKDAFDNCDVAYRCTSDKAEEFLVVRSGSGSAAWSWEIDLRSAGISLRPVLHDCGIIEFLDASATARLRIPMPEGKDAYGEALSYGGRLKFALEDSGNGRVRLTLKADLHGLAFPIVIDPSFHSTANLNFARANHTATVLQPNNVASLVLIAGGEGTPSLKSIPQCELFDPTLNAFTLTGDLFVARQQHVAALLPNGTVLVAGGLDNTNNPLNTGEIFSPGAGTWAPILTSTLSAPRTLHSVSILTTNGNVMISGGTVNGTTPLTNVDIYDPVAGGFAQAASMGTARKFFAATTLVSGAILATGGQDSSGNPIQSAEVFDPVAMTWSPTASTMSTARYSHKGVLLNQTTGLVLIAGGFNPGLFPSAETYDPATNSFNPTGSMTRVRTEHRIALLGNGKVILCGCHDGSFANVELYDPFTTPLGSFQITNPMTRPHTKHTLTTMPDGRILVVGGTTGPILNFAEYFDPHSEPTPQAVTANGPTPLAITFTTNSIDDQAPTFAAASQPAHGTLSVNGANAVYTAAAGYSGPDTFNIISTDSFGPSAATAITVTVNSLVPTISAMSPNASIAGSPGFTIIVNGSGFVTGSIVQFNGGGLPTTFFSTTKLSAVVPASSLAAAGNANITVFNPAPGGGASAAQTFNVMSGTLGVWIVTNTQDSGTGSLRFCMNNVRSGDSIIFDPNVFALVNSSAATVINVLSALPAMDKGNVTIDASNVRVTVNGSAAGTASGLLITSNNNKIMGLSIVGFTNDGIQVNGGTTNQLGGSRALPGTGAGPNGQGLRIAGNGAFGIEINLAGSANVVKGCWVGLDASGAAPEPNLAGILMQAGASNNVIGSIVSDEANFVSGNLFEGITVSDVGTNNNVVIGNLVGAAAVSVASASLSRDASDFSSLGGRSAVGNGSAGVFLSKGTNSTQVGGDTTAETNGVGNNGGNGIEVRASLSRKNTSKGNKISKNKKGGIALFDGSNDGIQPPHIDVVFQNVAPRDTTSTANIHIQGHASSDGAIEIYTDPDTQGGTLWGRTPCVGGQFQTDVTVNPTENITATLTDSNGNTSAFAVFGPSPTVGAPAITSPLTEVAMIGTPFSLQLTASGTQPVTYGASQLPAGLALSGDTITGTPTAGGTFMIHITATNSAGTDSKTLILIVNTSFTLDSDGDGVPDWLEVLAGTDPNNPLSFPSTQDPLSVDSMTIKLGPGTGPDTLSAQMRVTLPAGLVAAGTMVSVQVGNVIRPGFMLDARGRASKGTTSVMIKPSSKGSTTMTVVFSIKNDKLKTTLAGNGLTDVTTGTQGSTFSLPVGVAVSSKGASYVSSNSVTVLYKAKKGKGGSAKKSQ